MRLSIIIACGAVAVIVAKIVTAPPPGPIPKHNPTVDVTQTSDAVLDEWDAFLKIPMVKRPWIEWQEPEWHSQHLHVGVSDLGWSSRHTVPVNAEATQTVWCFGDSQVFGDWISDEQTIPSRLAALTKARVVNHGHCGHTSAQSVALFQSLLREGRKPDVAILFSSQNEGASDDRPVLGFDSHPTPEDAVRRWQVSWCQFEATAQVSGVKPLLVLVPISYAHDELDKWRRIPEALPREMRERAKTELGCLKTLEGALDLRDGFERYQNQPIIDTCHFSPGFDVWIADQVAKKLERLLSY